MCCLIGMGTLAGAAFACCRRAEEEEIEESENKNYYLNARKVLHGLPIAAVVAVAAGYFASVGVMVAATYGAVNYTILTFLVELHGPVDDEKNLSSQEQMSGLLIIGTSYLIGTLLVNTLLKTNLSFLAAVPLAVGAYLGHLARSSVASPVEEKLFPDFA